MHVRDIVLYLIKIIFYLWHLCGLCVEIRSRTFLKNYLLMALIAFWMLVVKINMSEMSD